MTSTASSWSTAALGRGAGDRLLVDTAARLVEALRPDDTVARFGGEEFVVLCEGLNDQADAELVAERVRALVDRRYAVEDAEIFMTVSTGIAYTEDPEATPEDLIRDADAAMYQATESVLMDDVERAGERLHQFHDLGVCLIVDDFGTGYSSLSYLSRFPVDLLEVDRSFVRGLGSDPTDTAIVRAVITLAHNLGLRAVGEGVERTEHLDALRSLGCDLAQGFLLGRPQPAPTIGDLLDGPRPGIGVPAR